MTTYFYFNIKTPKWLSPEYEGTSPCRNEVVNTDYWDQDDSPVESFAEKEEYSYGLSNLPPMIEKGIDEKKIDEKDVGKDTSTKSLKW